MREIKFRAWDGKKMVRTFCVTSNGCVRRHLIRLPDKDLDDYVVMQFTGLFDKNGKEIYEGDIIKVESDMVTWGTGIPTGNKSVRFYTVVWVEEYARFTTKREDGHIENSFGLRKDHSAKWFEVIGNVYQNPELLENKNDKEKNHSKKGI